MSTSFGCLSVTFAHLKDHAKQILLLNQEQCLDPVLQRDDGGVKGQFSWPLSVTLLASF